MQTGAFALIDALGFRGIWQRHEPAKVLALLDQMSQGVDAVADRFRPQIGFRAAFLSDTIALGVTLDPSFGGGPLLTLARMIAAICASAATGPVPLAYRGCVTFGDFEMTERFLIGRAVDEAAGYHEQSDAAIVWFAPEAHRRFVELSKGATVEVLTSFDVPMKGGGTYSTTAVNPLARGMKEDNAHKLASAILRTFDGENRLDVAMKKQNTARFLQACLKASGFGSAAP